MGTNEKFENMINMEAYTDFWWWVNERHRIYLKKQAGEPKPWTSNAILQSWRFCNVFRQLDTQSQYLHGVLTGMSSRNTPSENVLFNIFVFRAFNWYPTYFALHLWEKEWNKEIALDTLYVLSSSGQITSGAYMLRGREGMPKYESICLTLDEVWNQRVALLKDIQKKNSLENTFNAIMSRRFWGWANFTSYQVCLDTLMTDRLGFTEPPIDLNTWCEFGPGARRGLREIWPDIPLQHEWMVEACKWLLADQVKYREDHVPPLNLQDIEFSLCELSKYRRIKAGGRGKATYNGTN